MAPRKNPTMEETKVEQSRSASPSNSTATKPSGAEQMNASHKAGTTRVKIRCNCGFSNNLFIRGKGANLSWDKGQMLKNMKADEWIWETTAPFTQCEFKVLINDQNYEQGENHQVHNGDTIEYTPRF